MFAGPAGGGDDGDNGDEEVPVAKEAGLRCMTINQAIRTTMQPEVAQEDLKNQ